MHQCSPRSTCLEKNMQSVPVTSWQYPYFSTQRSTLTHSHTLRVLRRKKKRPLLRYQKGITCLTTCQSSCHWLLRICKEKLGWWRKTHWVGAGQRKTTETWTGLKWEYTSQRFDVSWMQKAPQKVTKRNKHTWHLLLLLRSTNLLNNQLKMKCVKLLKL